MGHEHNGMYNNNSTMMMDMGENMAAMHMSLFWGKDVTILFDGWPDKRLGMYILSLVFIFFLAVAVELLSATTAVTAAKPLSQAGVYALRIALGYLVMLAVMSFNIGVFIAAVVGHAFGYFLVKFRTLAAAPTADTTTKV